MRKIISAAVLLCIVINLSAQVNKPNTLTEKEKLTEVLGYFPPKPDLKLDTLEKIRIDNGWRYKIKYLAEIDNSVLNMPEDWVYAYLFVPDHDKGKKLPAIVAIHQDDVSFDVGKDEPAGLRGDSTMFYGIELYNRGYVVICPDRYYHAERRLFGKNPWFDFSKPDYERDYSLWNHQVGVLFMKGQSHYSKEAYDLSRAVDVLYTFDYIDKNNIGAIGHSGGGVALAFFLFYDTRVALGVSSCGVYDIARTFYYTLPSPFPSMMALPNLLRTGYSTADFIRHIYPRSLILTRGAHEWGKGDEGSKLFIEEVRKFENAYLSAGNNGDVTVIVFEENGGSHSFPEKVKEQVYSLIDEKLKN